MRNRGCRAVRPALERWAVLAGAFVLCACSPGGPLPTKPSTHDLETPTAHFEGVTFEGYRGTQPDFSIAAGRADVDGERRARLENVVIRLSQDRTGQVEIEAPLGRFEMATGAFQLEGGVRGTTANGERFRTAALRYDREARRLWTDTPVQLDRHGLALRAEGMQIDVSTQRIELTGGVRAELGGDS